MQSGTIEAPSRGQFTPTAPRVNPLREVLIAISVAAFSVAQIVLLAYVGGLPGSVVWQVWAIALVVAYLLTQAWMLRRYLPPHLDMLLLMLSWGGFGMLLGWQVDMGTLPPGSESAIHMRHSTEDRATGHDHGAMASQEGDAHQHAGHTQHQAASTHRAENDAHHHESVAEGHSAHGGNSSAFFWWNWMNGLMLLFALPPSIWWARCLQPYRAHPVRLARVLLFDSLGMILGMPLGMWLLGSGLATLLGAHVLAHHLAMLLGMLAGMYGIMRLRPWLAPAPDSPYGTR